MFHILRIPPLIDIPILVSINTSPITTSLYKLPHVLILIGITKGSLPLQLVLCPPASNLRPRWIGHDPLAMFFIF